jgi:hypothetical protein
MRSDDHNKECQLHRVVGRDFNQQWIHVTAVNDTHVRGILQSCIRYGITQRTRPVGHNDASEPGMARTDGEIDGVDVLHVPEHRSFR